MPIFFTKFRHCGGQVPLSDQWLVQGDLFYRLEGVDSGDEQPQDFVVADLPRILNGSSQSAEVVGGGSVPMQVQHLSALAKPSRPRYLHLVVRAWICRR